MIVIAKKRYVCMYTYVCINTNRLSGIIKDNKTKCIRIIKKRDRIYSFFY